MADILNTDWAPWLLQNVIVEVLDKHQLGNHETRRKVAADIIQLLREELGDRAI